ncbi:hypothetical protein SDC9_183888 [bioreactor metagenome]|uniref:Uncharacterized protein n=1 Tax=bioreactor metagenome TaxID=1076179 RepID=A0A645HE22_9ZZZZ
MQKFERVVCGRHVGNFDVVFYAVGNELLGFFHADFVLRGAGHGDIDLNAPGLLAGEELDAEFIRVILAAVAAGNAHLNEIIDLLVGIYPVGIVDITVRTGNRDDFAAELGDLLRGAPANVAKTGKRECLALEGIVLMLEYFGDVIGRAVAGGLGTN